VAGALPERLAPATRPVEMPVEVPVELCIRSQTARAA
jgi:hypothetical protein